jgi:hypothetical protein
LNTLKHKTLKTNSLNKAIEKLMVKLDEVNKLIDSNINFKRAHLGSTSGNIELEQLNTFKISKPTDWKKYQELFQRFLPNTYHTITKKYSNTLSESEFRLLLILKCNRCHFSIAEQLGICKESARVSIYRLRQKLNIKSNGQLFKILDEIEEPTQGNFLRTSDF